MSPTNVRRKIRDNIRATMYNIVDPWTGIVVGLGGSRKIHDAGSILRVSLPALFLGCLNEVMNCRRNIVFIFLGNPRD